MTARFTLMAGATAVLLALGGTAWHGSAQSQTPASPAAKVEAKAAPKGPPEEPRAKGPVVRHITQGPATKTVENMLQCADKLPNNRASTVGTITATDGTVLTVPAKNQFKEAKLRSTDLHNVCFKIAPANITEARALIDKAPVVEIDADGEVVSGVLAVDNYFELYVNGKLVAVDTTPFTPMNASIVRFKVKKPYTIAIYMVDWEENLGLGSELNRQNPWHPGDAGLVARFSDGTVSDSTWKAQSFYVGPVESPDDVIERASGIHDTEHLGQIHPLKKPPTCQDKCFAVHYPIPKGWETANFDDKAWSRAFEFTDAEVGVNGIPGYTRFRELYDGARWIWSRNLVLDNVVIARKTVR